MTVYAKPTRRNLGLPNRAWFFPPCDAGELATPMDSAQKLAPLSYLPQLPAASDYLLPIFGSRCACLEKYPKHRLLRRGDRTKGTMIAQEPDERTRT